MGGFELIWGLVPVIVIAMFVFASSVRILREYERGVIFRFGRRANAIFNPGGDGSGPGLVLLIPFIDKMVKVSLRTITMDVPPQDVITRDNVSVKVNAVIFFRVLDANKAVISVEDYLYATSQMAQTTLRSVLGQQELDDLLASREKINEELTRIIDQHTSPWGVKVAAVEVKNVDLPQDMQRAMSKQAEAERERRAKVINAEGEFQAAAKLAEAADVLTRFPIAVQLRYLQTMREIASERNTTTFFPAAHRPLRAAAARDGRGADAEELTRSKSLVTAAGPAYNAGVRSGGLAQLGERGVRNAEVEGSNPLPSTMKSSREKSRSCPSIAPPASEAWTPVDAPEARVRGRPRMDAGGSRGVSEDRSGNGAAEPRVVAFAV